VEHVGVGLRAVATLIDTALLFVIGYLIALASGGATADGFHLQGVPFAIWIVVALSYYIVLEGLSGATPGKRLIGLKVVRLEGGAPLDWQSSIVRNLLRLVDGLFFYLVAAIAVWTSGSRQRLGDRLAGTVVVRAPKT